jgi:hypothetical protein
MSHNAGVVLLGATRSNIKEVGNRVGSIEAGVAVRLKSDGTISTISSDGSLIGVSLGRDLSDTDKTAICYKGIGVPVLLTASFTPVLGAAVWIDNATGKAKGSATDTTAVNASFASAILQGIRESDGSQVNCALVDFPGGL